jgi:hypothetical protein
MSFCSSSSTADFQQNSCQALQQIISITLLNLSGGVLGYSGSCSDAVHGKPYCASITGIGMHLTRVRTAISVDIVFEQRVQGANIVMKKTLFTSLALLVSLGVTATVLETPVKADAVTEMLAQAEAEPTCVDLQEVTTGQTQIRRQIKPGFLGPGNIHTDFSVPSTENFEFFEVVFVPENDANYQVDINFRYSDGTEANVFSGSGNAQRGETYSQRLISPTGQAPFLINTSVAGENNIAYSVTVKGCVN